MTSTYKVGVGWDIALGSLALLVPQPMSQGIQYARLEYSGDSRVVIWQGAYAELVWTVMESKDAYKGVLSAFSILTAQSARVTVYLRDNNFDYNRYNGIAVRGGASWRYGHPRDATVLIRDLVAI
jgi:hypothetical protein